MKFDLTYDLIVDGHKTLTSRAPYDKWYSWYKGINVKPKYANAEAEDGRTCKILLIGCNVLQLGYVAQNKYWEEGFSSIDSFVQAWIKLHGRYDEKLYVCSIEFKKV